MESRSPNDGYLNFCIDEVRTVNGYGGPSEERRRKLYKSKKQFILKMIKMWSDKINKRGETSSKWDLPFVTNVYDDKNYVMFLDIDTPEYLPLACRHIEIVFECKYTVIESSPNKYWVVVDYSTRNIDYLRELIATVPGYDQNWLNVGKDALYLRAFMKGAPDFRHDTVPKFSQDEIEWEDPIAKNWYNAFKDYWTNDFIVLRDALQAHQAVKDGKVGVLIANPEFKVGIKQ